jgi:hypothetical protein
VAQDGQVLELCGGCRAKQGGTVHSIAQARKTTGSYALGFLGAVLGAVLGIIPWVLLGLVGYISSLGGLLMAYFAYKGSRLMHGRHSHGMLLLLVLVLIVFAYVAVMTSEGVNAFRDHAGDSASDLISEIGGMMTAPLHPEVYSPGLIWTRLGAGWLFAGLGSFGLMLRFRRETTGKISNTSRMGSGR